MIIVVKENENGKVELTKEELEKIANDAREDGYAAGYAAGSKTSTFTWPSNVEPYYYNLKDVRCTPTYITADANGTAINNSSAFEQTLSKHMEAMNERP